MSEANITNLDADPFKKFDWIMPDLNLGIDDTPSPISSGKFELELLLHSKIDSLASKDDVDVEEEFLRPTGFQGVDGMKPRFEQVDQTGFFQNRDELFPRETLIRFRRDTGDAFATPRILRVVSPDRQ